ncbi:hypothetical protein CDD83_1770 [Cordyceps sp. RAO-2017]|nr:hypothetical protein CDD83_1770 [Cordyceps sp. RAO-2017]
MRLSSLLSDSSRGLATPSQVDEAALAPSPLRGSPDRASPHYEGRVAPASKSGTLQQMLCQGHSCGFELVKTQHCDHRDHQPRCTLRPAFASQRTLIQYPSVAIASDQLLGRPIETYVFRFGRGEALREDEGIHQRLPPQARQVEGARGLRRQAGLRGYCRPGPSRGVWPIVDSSSLVVCTRPIRLDIASASAERRGSNRESLNHDAKRSRTRQPFSSGGKPWEKGLQTPASGRQTPAPDPSDGTYKREKPQGNQTQAKMCRNRDSGLRAVTGAAYAEDCHMIPYSWNENDENLSTICNRVHAIKLFLTPEEAKDEAYMILFDGLVQQGAPCQLTAYIIGGVEDDLASSSWARSQKAAMKSVSSFSSDGCHGIHMSNRTRPSA